MSAGDRLVTAGTVARRIGKDARTVRRWMAAGEIPGFQRRGRWYTTAAGLDLIIAQHAPPTVNVK